MPCGGRAPGLVHAGQAGRPGRRCGRRPDADHVGGRWHRRAVRSAQRHERLHRRGRGERQRVGRRHAGRAARARARRGAPCGRPRRGGHPTPCWPSPSTMVSGAQVGAGEEDAPRPVARPGRRIPRSSARALCSAGTRSGSTPARRSASAVAGPTAATSTPPRARASRSSAMKRSTALTEVSTTHWWSCTAAAAARSAAPPSDGSTWRVNGSSRAVAPARSSASTRPSARGPERVTTTVRPASEPATADRRRDRRRAPPPAR